MMPPDDEGRAPKTFCASGGVRPSPEDEDWLARFSSRGRPRYFSTPFRPSRAASLVIKSMMMVVQARQIKQRNLELRVVVA